MDPQDSHHVSAMDLSLHPPQPIGIYGWRKRCLYGLVLVLMATVVINLVLTVWILRVLPVSLEGVGRLQIVPPGLKLSGEAEFLKPVYVNKLRSQDETALYVQSNKAVELLTTHPQEKHKISSKLTVDPGSISAKCSSFLVEDTSGNLQFKVADRKVTFGTGDAYVTGNIYSRASVITALVRSPEEENLEIVSNTSTVDIKGAGGLSLTARSGNVTFDSSDNINIQSDRGSVYFQSSQVIMNSLPRADNQQPTYPPPSTRTTSKLSPLVYQLCVCESGRLFLGLPSGNCATSSFMCQVP